MMGGMGDMMAMMENMPRGGGHMSSSTMVMSGGNQRGIFSWDANSCRMEADERAVGRALVEPG